MTKTKIAVRIMRADVPNGNGRVYPMSALEHCVERGKTETIFGTLGAPCKGAVDLNEVSHVVRNLRIEDGYLIGDIEILQTEKGDILGQLLDAVQIDFRAAGTGNLGIDFHTAATGKFDAGTVLDFTLVTIDALYDGADL